MIIIKILYKKTLLKTRAFLYLIFNRVFGLEIEILKDAKDLLTDNISEIEFIAMLNTSFETYDVKVYII